MVSEYAAICLKDLLKLLDETAIDVLKEPSFSIIVESKGSCEDLTEFLNNSVAMHNHGVMRLRGALREAIMKEADK